MMARRLKIGDSSGKAPRAIPGVPAPLSSAGRAHSLAQTLEIALDVMNLTLGYEAVMGLSGLAWRTPPWPKDPTLSCEEAVAAAESLGAALGGSIRLIRGDDGPSPMEAYALVQAAVDAGRPSVALGWGSVKDEWSIVCGYDPSKERLLGHCLLDEPREQYESWPPEFALLLTLTSTPRPSGRDAIDRSLRAASQRLSTEGASSLRECARELRESEEVPSFTHEVAIELLADARSSAAGFAEQVAHHSGEIAAAWLMQAANLWRSEVELIESRGAPHTPEALAWLETREGREAWAATIERAASLDERAAGAVKCSSTADYLPSEVDAP